MKKLILASLGCAGMLALLPETGHAHGGQYRGPGDVVPPNPGGGRGGGPGGPGAGGPGGPSTPGPGGPAAPGPAGPGTGGPAGPAGGRGPTTGGRGVQIEDDLNKWEFWWEFNKDPYIRLKDAIHSGTAVSGSDEFFLGATRKVESQDTMSPSEEDKLNVILPALKKAIDSTDQRDIASSCMVAMAKVGKNHPEFKLRDVFTPRLQKSDQEIRETAALAFGIAALPDEANVDMLVGLATDSAAGREACGQSEVNDRIRAFSCYGLGLIAHANADIALKEKVFTALSGLLDDSKISSRNIKVAAINGLSLLNANAADDAGKALIGKALKSLEGYYMQKLGSGEQLLQAHVPPAIAKLLGSDYPDHSVVENYKKLFSADLQEKGEVKRSSNDIPRSCALALGQLCEPCDDEKAKDADYCQMLLEQWKKHKDEQTRNFCMLALGQIGGQMNRSILLKEFDKAGKSLEKPWVALAMGVYAFEKLEREKAASQTPQLEEEFGRTLRTALEDVKDPSAVSSFAVALGLCQYKAAADDMRSLLIKSKSKSDLAGYLCIGLALMDDKRSIEDIRDIVQKSVRRPELLQQAAVALGKLGDKTVADELQKLLSDGDTNLAKLSAVASALGFIGDRRTIDPLKRMLADESLTELSRAFAAVALGGVGDKEKLPWNSKIGVNMNYRASVETLTDKTSGILDIL
ncbi:MAG: HEAT repeat domain-containing protein [Planctomycetota bacterium]